MSTTRYKIRLWEYDGEASVANAVTFDSFDEAQARFNDLRVSEEMPCVEFIKERIVNGCIIGDEVLNVRQFTSVFDAMLEKLKKAGHDDAFITYSGTSGGTSERKITTGSKVRVKAGAKTYSGGSLASFVYSRDHIVKELSGKRAVITYGGTVVAAVNVDDLTLV